MRSFFDESCVGIFILTWFVMLEGSLLNFLNFHRYPLLLKEVGVLMLSAALMAAAAGCIHAKSGRARLIMEAALVYLAIDLNADFAFVSAAAIGAAIVYVAIRWSTMPFIGIVFMAVCIGQLWTATFASAKQAHLEPSLIGDPNLPAVIHIILDEHIGVGGLASDDTAHRVLATELSSFYKRHGFTVYSNAFSRHAHTISSIPEMMNFGMTELNQDSLFKKTSKLRSNSYFDSLAQQGYHINVMQSSFVDYCGHPAVYNCATYPHNDLHGIASSQLSVPERVRLLASGFVTLSTGLTNLTTIYDRIAFAMRSRGVEWPILNPGVAQLTMPLASLDAAESFRNSLLTAKPGNVYFAHLLLPHFPHVTTPSCEVKPFRQWSYLQYGGDLDAQFRGYSDQVRCAMYQIDMMLTALAQSPSAKHNVVIVHGDHGSRIVLIDAIAPNSNRIPESDMRSLFSTLFAVRNSGQMAGEVPRSAPVSDLLRELAAGRFKTAPPNSAGEGERDMVYIADEEWRPTTLRTPPRPAKAPIK